MNERELTHARGGMIGVLFICCAIGAVTVGATLMFGLRRYTPSIATVPPIATEEYGKRLIAQTAELLGPHNSNPKMHFSGSGLNCGSCHLGTGTEPGTLTLLEATEHYPRVTARTGKMTSIEDRVNECLTRSMNGQSLSLNSPEMIAMAAYIRSLGARNAAMGARVSRNVRGAG